MDFLWTFLNIGGSEWWIIGLLALFLLFGSKKLPEFTRAIGKAVGEYEKARNLTRNQLLSTINPIKPSHEYKGPKVQGPVESEHQKLEKIALSLGIEYIGKEDEELRSLIFEKMKE